MSPAVFRARRLSRRALAAFAVSLALNPSAPAAPASLSAGAILQELRNFDEMGRVLYVAAHPDDENTRLIAYLARGRGYRTGYLSLTRGDGGQNLLGPELRDQLGVIRTQELLAARRIDGGVQFFTRANDFGFSKSYEETLAIWNRDQVLADVVRVIRTFRPDVIITRFSLKPGGTHGHHTASAMLAVEAFKLAGDPQAYPEQLTEGLTVWQPRRALWNAWPAAWRPGSGGVDPNNDPAVVQLDVGGFDPLLGESYGEIAARSRTQHKSQGFGSVGARGAAIEYFKLLAGEPASHDIFDGVDTTWARIPGGAAIGRRTGEIIRDFDPLDPVASVPAMLEVRAQLAALPADPLLVDKRRQFDRALVGALGLHVECTIPQAEAVPGEKLALTSTVIVRNPFPLRWTGVRFPATGTEIAPGVDLQPNVSASAEAAPVLPANTPLTQPYWLRKPGTTGMFRVDDSRLIGRPENPPAFPVEQVFEIAGQTLVVPDEPIQIVRDRVKGELHQALVVIPPVSLDFGSELELFAPGHTRTVTVKLTAARANAAGTVKLSPPAGWRVSPATQAFRIDAAGGEAAFAFNVTAPAAPAEAMIEAEAEIDGVRCRNRRIEIRYDHIPRQLLQPVAQLKAVSLDLAIRGRTVGYLPGAGDRVADAIARMGYAVTTLSDADLTPERLRAFDAVVLGVRALNIRRQLPPHLPALWTYVENGGTVIEQYNTTDLLTPRIAPYDLHLSHDRVTDETAAVTLLAPDHPALTTPNRIGPADFDGWVQERGLYFPDRWDAHFTPILACHDAGEPPKSSALLIARHGRGYFVYTGLSWFRELPEGVPGAYRLFANLLSLGK
jgi:LmbE family N-acetylglucosaminyl deacetylase